MQETCICTLHIVLVGGVSLPNMIVGMLLAYPAFQCAVCHLLQMFGKQLLLKRHKYHSTVKMQVIGDGGLMQFVVSAKRHECHRVEL